MQVQSVHRAARHDVDPAVGHDECPGGQVELERASEGPHMPLEAALQFCERGRDGVQTADRVVRRVATGVALCRPFAASPIVEAQLATFTQQALVEFPPVALQWRTINERREELE